MKKLLLSILCIGLFFSNTQINANETNACDPTETCESSEKSSSVTFTEITMDEALSFFSEKKSGILFFGYEQCPYCQQAKPILAKVSKKEKQTIYYIKVRDENKNLLYTDQQREQLAQLIPNYMQENEDEDNKLWLYVPLVLSIKDGDATDGHEGTVKGHDASKRKMTKKEKKKLKKIYTRLMQN